MLSQLIFMDARNLAVSNTDACNHRRSIVRRLFADGGAISLRSLSQLLRAFPGKSLGWLRIPIDLALIKAGFESADQAANPWVLMVGVAGLISSIVLVVFADRTNHSHRIDPQDARHTFKWLLFWKYPWEFASAMAFVKVVNFLISGISRSRADDLFLGLCILIGQAIVQIPERKATEKVQDCATRMSRIRDRISQSPNRVGAYIMSLGNVVFAAYALSPFELFRFFAGVWNILLNSYLMARSSKRLKTD